MIERCEWVVLLGRERGAFPIFGCVLVVLFEGRKS